MDVAASKQRGSVSNKATGSWTGDGTVATVNCGFQPRHVVIHNMTDVISIEKMSDMADTVTLQHAAAGANSAPTSSQIVITENGFTVAAAVNISAKSFVFEAMD